MNYLSDLLVSLVGIAFAMTIHEFGHAFAAYLLGDDTAKRAGRMTINPANHIDIVGLVMLMIFHFGWAKPVPVNPNNFKNYKVGNVIVSLAGVTANIIISIICVIIKKHVNMYAITEITSAIIIYNVSFAAFNLLPIPPLDGWGVISSFIPYKYNEIAYKYESMSSIIFLVLIITGAYSIFVSPIINVIWDILYLFM